IGTKMTGTKLTELLLSLSKRRNKELVEFFSLSFVGLNPDAQKLGKYILSLGKKPKERFLQKEDIEKMVFEGKIIAKKDWNYMTNNLLNATNKYLMQELGNSNDFPTTLKLLHFYLAGGLKKNYSALFNKWEKKLTDSTKWNNRNQDYHYYQFKLKEIELILSKSQRKKDEGLVLVKIEETLKNFSLENRLRLLCEMINRRNIVNAQYLIHDLKGELTEGLENDASLGVRLYYSLYKMITDRNDESHYHKVLLLMEENKGHFGEAYTKTLEVYLMNQCAVYINQGKELYAAKYVYFLEQQIKAKIFVERNEVSIGVYKNAVTAALIANELDWGENFIKTFSPLLVSDKKESIEAFNLAQIDFQRGNFEEASNKLIGFQPFDMYYRISYERLILKTYYELGEMVALNSKLNTFSQYIQNQTELNPNKKEKLKNFIKCLKRLINQKPIHPQLSKIGKEMPLIDLMWFRQKAKKEQ
ncbi:MAG: hypothetical protein ACPG49_13630, partial [Chitinophagales bacterium]